MVASGKVFELLDALRRCDEPLVALMEENPAGEVPEWICADADSRTVILPCGVDIVASRRDGDVTLEIVYNKWGVTSSKICVDCKNWLKALDLQERVVSYVGDYSGAEV